MAGATTDSPTQSGSVSVERLHTFQDMFQGVPWRALARLVAVGLIAVVSPVCLGQNDFQIVWVVIGEAATAENGGPARAARHLFMAPDLLDMSMNNVKVSRVDVQPAVTEIDLGERLCLSSLSMRAFGPDQQLIAAAPLSIAVRQDHRERLGLRRSRRDVCLRPHDPGEYPVRLTSLMPAPDGTMRGAQLFLRVRPAPTP